MTAMSTLVAHPSANMYPSHSYTHSHAQHTDHPRRHKKMLRDGSGEVWPDHAEQLFASAITEYDRQSSQATASSPYPPDLPSRNEFIVRFLAERGLQRSKQQVASHIQQLKKRTSKELNQSQGSASPNGSPGERHLSVMGGRNTMAAPTSAWVNPYTGQTSPAPMESFYPNGHSQPNSPYAQAYATTVPSQYRSPTSPTSPNTMSSSPITNISFRINATAPLSVSFPPNTNMSTPPNRTSNGTASITSLSPPNSSSGSGMRIGVRVMLPPHTDLMSHLSSGGGVYSIISLGASALPTMRGLRMVGNKISVGDRYLCEETDQTVVQEGVGSGGLVVPLRMSPNTGMMVGTQGGAPVTIEQTLYSPASQTSSNYLMKITWELISPGGGGLMSSSALPAPHTQSAFYATPPNAGPFTQF